MENQRKSNQTSSNGYSTEDDGQEGHGSEGALFRFPAAHRGDSRMKWKKLKSEFHGPSFSKYKTENLDLEERSDETLF